MTKWTFLLVVWSGDDVDLWGEVPDQQWVEEFMEQGFPGLAKMKVIVSPDRDHCSIDFSFWRTPASNREIALRLIRLLGLEGWEPVSFVGTTRGEKRPTSTGYAYFKRPIEG